VSNVNGNGKTVTVTILATLLVLGIAGLCAFSLSASANQSKHEVSKESHGIDKIASDISTISSNVQTIMIQQGVQAETMKNMAEDIAELKDGQ